MSPLSLNDFSSTYGVSSSTLKREFKDLWNETVIPKVINLDDKVLILDAIYLHTGGCMLIATTPKKVVTWRYSFCSEDFNSWTMLLQSLTGIPLVVVIDGRNSLIKAVKTIFPNSSIQRYQFHVLSRCHSLLPSSKQYQKTKCILDFKNLMQEITSIKSKANLAIWLSNLYDFTHNYDFELSVNISLKNAYNHLLSSLPYIFTYLLYPNYFVPNTTNHLEGGINSTITEILRRHRGLTRYKQIILISHFLKSKQ